MKIMPQVYSGMTCRAISKIGKESFGILFVTNMAEVENEWGSHGSKCIQLFELTDQKTGTKAFLGSF